jgi:L-ascorbate oxidase
LERQETLLAVCAFFAAFGWPLVNSQSALVLRPAEACFGWLRLSNPLALARVSKGEEGFWDRAPRQQFPEGGSTKMKRKTPRRYYTDERQFEPGEVEEKEIVESGSDSKEGVSRRRFLIAGTGAAAAAVIAGESLVEAQKKRRPGGGQGGGGGGGQGGGGGGGGQGGNAKPPRISALNLTGDSSDSPTFAEPEAACARTVRGQSVLNLILNVELTNWRFQCNGQAYGEVPIYNGAVPGPTMYVDPGSQINIVLNNKLPKDDTAMWPGDHCGQMKMDGTQPTPPECFMHTNLHTHGLLVSPSSILTNGMMHGFPNCETNPQPPDHCGPVEPDKIKVSSDDVLVNVPPGTRNNYCIVLPDFHEPGTYWYHAHTHGSTAYQVASGMAGALIIREPVGQEIVQDDRDHVLLMQEVVFDTTLPPSGPLACSPISQKAMTPAPSPTPTPPQIPPIYTEQSTTAYSAGFLINGQCKPTLQMKTGQTHRWRFINGTGSPRGLMKLRLIKICDDPTAIIKDNQVITDDPNCLDQDGKQTHVVIPGFDQNAYMHLIAVDGISFFGFPPQPVRYHLMAAGNRADFLVNIPATKGRNSGVGKYVLVKDGYPKDAVSNLNPKCVPPGGTAGPDMNDTVPASLRSAQILAYIEVFPSDDNEQLPSVIPGTRPDYLRAIEKGYTPAAHTLAFKASGGSTPGAGSFSINDRFYDPNDPGVVSTLNTAEQWILTNSGNDIPHPFHIHVNPFQVEGRTIDSETDNPKLDPKDPKNWMWMDTVAIPAQLKGQPPGQLQLRTRFLAYPGEYVLHCHILIHEDRGMMVNVTIKDDANKNGVGPCVTLPKMPPASCECIRSTINDPYFKC